MPANLARNRIDTRSKVLEAALHLFAGGGYFNTSVHDIQREAQVSIGSIYHHFGDKEGVARALYTELLEQTDGELKRINERGGSAQERCRAAVALLFEMTEAEPKSMQFILHAQHREFLPNEPPICSSAPFRRMREMVEAGIQSGEIRPLDAMIAAACLFGGPIRLIHLRLDGVLAAPLQEHLETAWDCAWRAVAV
ncbi:TetR/AcrR family transcriptional regulator [Thiohalomonas denitrificans]|uniref:Transcriptional regulator, TetR family n=1 Tax=Thiohalomonas denitrificans TaxID=415747 RepID=A0A1G5QDQ4_9GAMM|nr:TetR/AcrR family transcriptional regulator [Thiohalomonas denitrificans]SCZ59993.1 transcriptional regulator, TetR family [Thiohalomonas denitrificans]